MDEIEYPEMAASAAEALYEEALMVLEGSNPERAVQMFEDLMAYLAIDHAVDSEEMIELRMYLGRALWLSGLAERAIPVLRAAWADSVRVTGAATRLSFSCAGNLCRALGAARQFEEAFAIAGDSYALREKEFGELDNGTLNSLGHIAHLQYEAGLLEDAVETMDELLARRTEAFGPHDARTESSRYNLAVMQARLAESGEEVTGETMAHFVELYGEFSAPVIGLHAQRAAIHEDNDELADALREWEYVERMRVDLHGELALPTLTATARKLWVMWQMGDASVETHFRVVGQTIARIAGQEHPTARWCLEASVAGE